MALTIVCKGAQGASTHDRYLAKVEFRGTINLGTYATDGIAATAAAFTTAIQAATEDYGVTISAIDSLVGISQDGLLTCIWDSSGEKIKAVVNSTGAEVADTTDLSAAAKTFLMCACTLSK